VGIIATVISVRAGIGVAGLFLAPALVLYARTLRGRQSAIGSSGKGLGVRSEQ